MNEREEKNGDTKTISRRVVGSGVGRDTYVSVYLQVLPVEKDIPQLTKVSLGSDTHC